MAEDKLATFKCDRDLWERFRAKAELNNTNASALLKAFVQDYLDGRIDAHLDGAMEPAGDIDERIEAVIERLVTPKIEEMNQRLGKLSAA